MITIKNDEQFVELFNKPIASNYKEALLFMNVDPDISLMKFRKILETLCLLYAKDKDHDFEDNKLCNQIDELEHTQLISGVNKGLFHDIRMLTNRGVHAYNEAEQESHNTDNKEELIAYAIDSRKGILNLLETAYLDLKIGNKIPKYEMAGAGGQEYKDLWFTSITSSDYSVHFEMGEFYQELGEVYAKLIIDKNDYVTNSNSMFVLAQESYKSAFKFATKLDVETVISTQGKGIKIAPNSHQSLFNYALLCLQGKVEKHGVSDAKILFRSLIKREYSSAYSYLGWCCYLTEDYNNALKYLTHNKAQQDVFTWQKLGVLYSEDKACSINMDKAIGYFKQAAELDDVESLFQLGRLYNIPNSILKNDEQSKTYLRKAIDMGHTNAFRYFTKHFFNTARKMEDLLKLINETDKNVPLIANNKQQRNNMCSCGSGKKYKKCCLIN